MAEDFIEEIYNKSTVIFEIKRIIKYCRRNQAHLLQIDWKYLQQPITDFCKDTAMLDSHLGTQLWNEFVSVVNEIDQNDYNLAADHLESLIPQMYKAIELIGEIDVTDDIYRLFSTKSGFLGIQNISTNDYLTGIIDPAWESYEKACEIYRPTMTKFCTLGCNLGYLCWQMYEVSNQSIDIYIYDLDATMYNYAINYGVLSKIPSEKIHLIIDNDSSSLVLKYLDNYDSYSNDKTVLNMEPDTIDNLSIGKDSILSLFITLNSDKNLYSLCRHNFYRNIDNVPTSILKFSPKTKSKDYIIVGGGPSVDYCLDYIKENIGKKTILAATTVYEKLLQENIIPDAIVCVDPQNRTFGHIEKVTNFSSPLILTDMANWQFGEKYKGRKYIIPTGDYFFAKRHYLDININTWETHGTVVGTCIDIAAYLGAKQIDLIGVDLSYPENHTHASGTMDNSIVNQNDLIQIKSNNGDNVYTSKIFMHYIATIEQLIKKYSASQFSNLSKNGAYIKGAFYKEI